MSPKIGFDVTMQPDLHVLGGDCGAQPVESVSAPPGAFSPRKESEDSLGVLVRMCHRTGAAFGDKNTLPSFFFFFFSFYVYNLRQ